MANFYAKIKQSLKHCDISFIEPLSYMQNFPSDSPTSEKIVLFYKIGQVTSTHSVRSPQFSETHVDESKHNLTGSPLKDSCQFDLLNESLTGEILVKKNAWNDDEEKYQCISYEQAQSTLNQILEQFAGQSTPKCWAICKSKDNTLMLSLQLNDGRFRRGILKFEGVIDFEPVNIAELQAKHSSYVYKQYGMIGGFIDSFYRLGNDALLQVSHRVIGSVTQSSLSDGKNVAKMLLHQSIPINGLNRSIAWKFWIQLGILDNIKESIVAFNDTKDPTKLSFESFCSRDLIDIKKDIFDLLTQPIPISVKDEDNKNEHNPNTTIEQIVKSAGERVSVELTDQLWDLLKDLTDHRLGSLPHLIGSEPLELLLEIGLEKLSKYYEFIFVECKLCTGEDLRLDKKSVLTNSDLNVRKSLKNQFAQNGASVPPRKTLMHNISEENVGAQNSKFNSKSIETDLARLGRIHLILEHLIMIKVNLNLDNVFTTILEDLRKPLIPFNVIKEMSTDSRSIPVNNTKILTKVANVPHRLRVFFESRNKFQIFRSTFFFSADPIFPPNVFESIDINDIKSLIIIWILKISSWL